MTLTDRERAVAAIANGIAVFSMLQSRGEGPPGGAATMHDFVLRTAPEGVRRELSADLIDEVFSCVTSAHSS